MFDRIRYCSRQLIIVIALTLAIVQPSYGITVEDVPQPFQGSYIVDLANILNTDTEAEINKEIATLQQHKNKSIYIITVASITEPKVPAAQKFIILSDTSPSRKFLNSIFSNWNIRQLHRGNSILILASIKDCRIEVKTGFNLRYITKDRNIQGIIDKIIIPEFERQNFNRGIALGTKALANKIENPYTDSTPQPNNPSAVGREYKNKALCQEYRSTFWCSSEGRDRGGGGNWRSVLDRQAIVE